MKYTVEILLSYISEITPLKVILGQIERLVTVFINLLLSLLLKN